MMAIPIRPRFQDLADDPTRPDGFLRITTSHLMAASDSGWGKGVNGRFDDAAMSLEVPGTSTGRLRNLELRDVEWAGLSDTLRG